MLVAGGHLRSAVLLLRKVGMPDCGQALAQAVAEANLDSKQGSADAGERRCTILSFVCWSISLCLHARMYLLMQQELPYQALHCSGGKKRCMSPFACSLHTHPQSCRPPRAATKPPGLRVTCKHGGVTVASSESTLHSLSARSIYGTHIYKK